jgi:uncharacterized protein (DUF1684 family)
MSELTDFRRSKDEFFADHPQSPLTHEQQADFSGLVYFDENPALDLKVEVEEFDEKDEIVMQTSTSASAGWTALWRN